jgi:glutamate formiminotransferase / 5-formyltetrahydrofolate cyclo-ligase
MIEFIPNVSEGRRPEVVEALLRALCAPAGVRLLNRTSDPSHNRSVFTVAGSADALTAGALALLREAIERIDLRTHRGVHPRMGAVDVMPFVPLGDGTLSECVAVARRVGAEAAARFHLPVFLYEAAAVVPERRRLENIRRGEFEGLAEKLADPAWAPDFGPAVPHPTAGALAVGARHVLIAFNVNLATTRVDIARRIAAKVRERDGGLPAVKALGLALSERGLVQVSMNLTDYSKTPPAAAFAAVQRAALALGIDVVDSELIGLIPQAALAGTSVHALRLTGFSDDQILEVRLARAD